MSLVSTTVIVVAAVSLALPPTALAPSTELEDEHVQVADRPASTAHLHASTLVGPGCGTEVSLEQYRWELEIRPTLMPEAAALAAGPPYYIPVTFHMVRRSDGTGGFPVVDFHLALTLLNDLTAQTGFIFFRLRDSTDQYVVDFIDDDVQYDAVHHFDGVTGLRTINPVPNTVNIYYAPHDATAGGFSSFPGEVQQGIMIRHAYRHLPGLLAHEVGHFFNLYHTHETRFGVECPDSSNCSSAGDRICDTPADPFLNFSEKVDGSCNYTGSDPTPGGCGGVYDPPTTNIMAYTPADCRLLFSPGQILNMTLSLTGVQFSLLAYDSTDTDGDGLFDVVDICPGVFNPLQEDSDGDYRGDSCDNCVDVVNDLQTNTDGDDFADACDNCPAVPNDTQTDIDSDGLGDLCDNCPADSNAAQQDADLDGLGDLCDACTDSDGDGYGDPGFPANACTVDNCAMVSNGDQADGNGDGVGDACVCERGSLFLPGEASGDFYGYSVGSAGDVNNDGTDDVLVGAPLSEVDGPFMGHAYVYSGSDGTLLYSIAADGPDSAILGTHVAGGADLNADGFDDFMVTGVWTAPGQSGAVHVFLGGPGPFPQTLTTSSSYRTYTGSPGDQLGIAAEFIDDIDGDSIPDILMGADQDPLDLSGKVMVSSGATGSEIYTIQPVDSAASFGLAVSAVGDANNDGSTDFIVGAPNSSLSDTHSGRAYLYSGPDGSLIHEFSGEAAQDLLGYDVGAAGDVDGDGYRDVLVGAPGHDAAGSASGRVYVFSGLDGSVIHSVDGVEALEYFGRSVAGLGDVDGDGTPDFAAGAPGLSSSQPGSARVYSGLSGSLLHGFTGADANNDFGFATDGQLDLNSDGVRDLIVGAYGATGSDSASGTATVYLLGDSDGDGLLPGCDNCPIEFTGDVDESGALTSADIITLVNYTFKGGNAPAPCAASGDVNCDGAITSSDIIYLVNHVFKGGGAPCDVCSLVGSQWSCP